ncbi:MAG: NAD(P)H-dependent oxidoreductase [Pseudomonadota bacterium]
MSSAPKLAFISGSIRTDAAHVKLAQLACKTAGDMGADAHYVDLADYELPIYNGDLEQAEGVPENAKSLAEKLAGFGGVFIASPEYNGGLSPLLKNTIDWLSRIGDVAGTGQNVFQNRVFAIGSAAASEMGGVRGLIVLRQVLAVSLGATVTGSQVQISGANKAFNEDGSLKDENRKKFLDMNMRKFVDVAAKMKG